MAKFLNTTAQSYNLELLVKEAKDILILVSPFVKINERLKHLIEHKTNTTHPIIIIYGKSKLNNDEERWLKSINNVNLYYCSNLHAKCYINDDRIILGSMNLFDYSQVNNYEIGVTIAKCDDLRLFNDVLEEVIQIYKCSKPIRIIEDVNIDEVFRTSLVMRNVFRDIFNRYEHRRSDLGGDVLYQEISEYAMSNHIFKPNELYKDGSAVLRSTTISRELYDKIYKHFTKIGIKKE